MPIILFVIVIALYTTFLIAYRAGKFDNIGKKSGDFIIKNPQKTPKNSTKLDAKNACKHQVEEYILDLSGYKDEITRLNNRVEGLSKENIQLRNSELMLSRQNKAYKSEISKLTSNMNEFKNERNEYRREVERLKKELSLVI